MLEQTYKKIELYFPTFTPSPKNAWNIFYPKELADLKITGFTIYIEAFEVPDFKPRIVEGSQVHYPVFFDTGEQGLTLAELKERLKDKSEEYFRENTGFSRATLFPDEAKPANSPQEIRREASALIEKLAEYQAANAQIETYKADLAKITAKESRWYSWMKRFSWVPGAKSRTIKSKANNTLAEVNKKQTELQIQYLNVLERAVDTLKQNWETLNPIMRDKLIEAYDQAIQIHPNSQNSEVTERISKLQNNNLNSSSIDLKKALIALEKKDLDQAKKHFSSALKDCCLDNAY